VRKSFVPLLTVLLLWTIVPARGQAPAADTEAEAVRKVVETYLFTEEVEEKKETLLEGARIVFVGPDGKETRVESISKRKGQTRGKVSRATQKVVSIDVLNDAASVKVETVLAPDGPDPLKHSQYLWLLKTEAGWKIAGILMPSVRLSAPADK
jgi:hypothetical protein